MAATERYKDGVEWAKFDTTAAILQDVHTAASDPERVKRVLNKFGGERFVKSPEAIQGIVDFAATINYAAGASLVSAGVSEVQSNEN